MSNIPSNTAFAPDGIITTLFNYADDHEASILQGLLVKSGYLWRCPECAATFGLEEETCEFCGTAQPGTDIYEPHCRFEYDLDFWGADYKGVGTFAYVPFSLMEKKGLPPEEAFEKSTGVAAAHIIHYSLSESYDAAGNLFDEGVAEALNAMRIVFAQNSITTIIYRLSHFCSIHESYKGENHEVWKTAEDILLQALARITELQKDGQVTLPRQLLLHEITEQTGDELAAILAGHSIGEALAATTHQARYRALQDDEQHAPIWKEAITLIIEPALDSLKRLAPTPALNC